MEDENKQVIFITETKQPVREKWNNDNREILLDCIDESPCQTPWKPQHGTNKEVWSAIVENFNSKKAYTGFTTNISWESAKDQFIAMLDRQRRQKKKGGFAAKCDAINAKIDGAPGTDESTVIESRKAPRPDTTPDLYDDRHKKLPKKSSGILLETSEPAGYPSVDLEIEKLRLTREKERDDAQRQRDERFAAILESHLAANKAVLEQVVEVLEQVKALLPGISNGNKGKK